MVRVRPIIGSAVLTAGLAVAVLPSATTGALAAPPPQTKTPVATGSGGAVASADLDASKAGIAVLRNGGNAIDAAVATASTLGVTEPFVAGPGGGGYMVIYLAKQHRVVTLDGREKCPASCTTSQFLDPSTGQPLPFEQARRSGLSVGVPGMVKTWSTAVSAYGRPTFADDLQPAIATAKRGFTDRQQLQPAGAVVAGRPADLPGQPRPVPDQGRPAAARSAAPCATPTSPARTRCWPRRGRTASTVARWARTSPASSTTRTSCRAWPTSRSATAR